MPSWLLKTNIVDGPFPLTVWGATAILIVVLLVRRPTLRGALTALVAVLGGAVVGVGTVLVLRISGVLITLPPLLAFWAGAGLGFLGLAIVSLWDTKVWRKVVAALTIVMVLLSVTLGVNAQFGIDRTIGDLIGESTLDKAESLPGPATPPAVSGPLYKSWEPPAGMPAKGKVLELGNAEAIPSSAGFVPRNASVYLPPAALVAAPPPLPLVVHMMGKPGAPTPQFMQEAMDKLAAENKGLAPIVIVADQLGGDENNPACADSAAFGGVSTYFNKDIPAYALGKLPVTADHRDWTISGYSNGGACAFAWGAEHPDVWGNVVSISGEDYQGSEEPDQVLAQIFGGDQAAYDAAKPAAVAARNKGSFAGHVAIFTVGANDPLYIPRAERSAAVAREAGFETRTFVIPDADHVVTALQKGIPEAYRALFPHLGLAPPAS